MFQSHQVSLTSALSLLNFGAEVSLKLSEFVKLDFRLDIDMRSFTKRFSTERGFTLQNALQAPPTFRHRSKGFRHRDEGSSRSGQHQFENVFQASAISLGRYAFGKTKLFFRAGILAQLEHLRVLKQGQLMTRIQKVFRGHVARLQYWRVHSAVCAQRAVRCCVRRFYYVPRVAMFRISMATLRT
jgi:hypothetical protein